MYKLGSLPSISSNISELADFIEMECLLSEEESYSSMSAKSMLSVGSDEINNEGIESEDDRISRRLEDVMVELKDRKRRCNNHYPFVIESHKIVLDKSNTQIYYIYIYLLLVTRLNMVTNKVYEGIDGTLLFEELSEVVAKSYFGDNTKSLLFGTSSDAIRNFKDKINTLLNMLEEGGQFRIPEGSNGMQKDGHLDIVVMKSFSDRRGGKLVGFGQCKTGTFWEGTLSQLQPRTFMSSYTTCTPYHSPVRMFFIAESCTEKWEENCRYGGILFDRCRLMDYLPLNISDSINTKIQKWVDTAVIDIIDKK